MKRLSPDINRLMDRLNHLAKIGTVGTKGVSRLALSDEDKLARDLLKSWMKDLKLDFHIDPVGNMIWIKKGSINCPPVFIGSHLDTVGSGGRYDGSLGVLAGLEIIQTFVENNLHHEKPLGLINFTNEEGVRFTPDMMGSYFLSGGSNVPEIHSTNSIDGKVNLRDELKRIGYLGDYDISKFEAGAYLELHIEQGPVLELENTNIGAVRMVQGISWLEFIIHGEANHAGTTPMKLRKDASYVAASIIQKARLLTHEFEGQVANAGLIEAEPNLINVVTNRVRFTVDLRNPDNVTLREVEDTLKEYAFDVSKMEETSLEINQLVRLDPVAFDEDIVDSVVNVCLHFDLSVKEMPSGAGHDAQMMADVCPTAMIFIPSKNGISHSPEEFSSKKDIENGLNVLFEVTQTLLA